MEEEAWRLVARLPVLVAAAIIIACYYYYLVLLRRRTSDLSSSDFAAAEAAGAGQKRRRPPLTSSSWWPCGDTLSFVAANSSGRGFYHFVRTRHLRYGSCFRATLFGRTHVFLLSLEAVAAARSLLAADPPHLSKRYVRTVAELLGEHSLLCSSHARHRFLRRALAPLFSASSTAAFAATFDRLTQELLMTSSQQQQHQGHKVVVLDGALRITLRAICEMLIGSRREEDEVMEVMEEQLQSDVMEVTQAMLALPLPRWIPGTRFHKGLQARKRIMDALRREISKRRENGLQAADHQRTDFLHTLLLNQAHSSPQEEDALTDQQILDNILTLIIAGQVTTATAITWMVKYLADNTGFQQTVRSIQLELASERHDSPLTLQDLNRMEFAYKAVKESLRMASIVSWFPRVALKDCEVAGFHIKKDWIVNVDARSIHYDPTIYANPTVFDPSRFNGEVKPYSFLVFGAGGRTCMGLNLAKIMMLIFLHRLVTTFRWEMAEQDESLEKWAMFPRLKNGCPILLTPINRHPTNM